MTSHDSKPDTGRFQAASPDDDGNLPRLRIKYEAPLPWLVGLIGIGIVQAAAVYYGQQRQGELISAQSVVIEQLRADIKTLALQVGTNNVADVRHDLQIADHERRINVIEQHQQKGLRP